jgi:hypothetical protein
MQSIHHHVDGINKLIKPPLHKCKTCLLTKATKRAIFTNQKSLRTKAPGQGLNERTYLPGQRFHMDMGLVRGSSYRTKDENGHLLTSQDGYNSYLIIVDQASCYTWIFLSKHKIPPIKVIENFLHTYSNKTVTQKYIRTDEGGELWASHTFQQIIRDAGYILETKASDASFQNGIAERPNRTLGDMMRALLHSAQLGPELVGKSPRELTHPTSPHRCTRTKCHPRPPRIVSAMGKAD